MSAIKDHPDLELMLVVGASALLYRFGNVRKIIEDDGNYVNSILYSIVEGENPTTMAKSTGVAIIELSTIFQNLDPDIVITVADRFETIATAIAASYMNIMVAHTQGGEITGSIDESVRHAVTKLSHIHFPATKKSADYIIRMGEDPKNVFCTGCPSIDSISNIDLTLSQDILRKYRGVGPIVNAKEPYLVVLQHPVTTEFGDGMRQINETLKAIEEISIQTVWLWPNVDAGSDDIAKGIRMFRERKNPDFIHFYRNFGVEDYARLINNCACLVGNSSSALREGAFLGVPVVDIGTRQANREHAGNVMHSGYDANEIEDKIIKQIKHGKYECSTLFGDSHAGERIANILAETNVKAQKTLHYCFPNK
jgi:UDP-hydrolysing UDP-N-acetyl-D-glucosamine 2-epimerase